MVYLFHGEDVLAGEEALAQLLREEVSEGALDLAVTRLEGTTLAIGDLIEHAEALPFLSPKRVVIVEGIARRLEAKGPGSDSTLLSQLRDYLPRVAATTLLVFRERVALPANHPLLALVQKVGQVREFSLPRGRELSQWIARQAQREGVEIASSACDLLAASAGTDPGVLRQEVEKLVTYVGPQGRIDERLVGELASAGRLSDIFVLVDAIGQRRQARAMVELRRLLQAGQHPLYILAMVVRQIRLLLEVKGLPVGERQPETVARALKIHPFVAEKVVAQAQAFRREELERIYHLLAEADREIKTGRRDDEVALELAVMEVSNAGSRR